MPQMMPMSWLTLYTSFLSMFMMFNIMIYYNTITQKKSNNNETIKTKVKIWKW
uniref:ATP synthase F0 subunit 8 n=1 Tax=Balta maculata TaxID=3037036 RepID=UPI0027A775EF|nr:ATP synthase F0 subunit 8 [Balta maculata]WGO57135.1 ATP synthase F0 subunit 8 [Balta maculata]